MEVKTKQGGTGCLRASIHWCFPSGTTVLQIQSPGKESDGPTVGSAPSLAGCGQVTATYNLVEIIPSRWLPQRKSESRREWAVNTRTCPLWSGSVASMLHVRN